MNFKRITSLNYKKGIKRLPKLLILLGFISVISIPIAQFTVDKRAKGKIYNSTKDIPYNKVGLLLGTSKILSNGRINLYYKYRIDAAVKLYKARKIDYILISGDNSSKDYDEPSTIKEDLIKKGIPSHRIYLDYAGFRTLDSVVRCKEIFGQQSITIISQQFHNERAIFIASMKDIDAIGYNAKDVSNKYGLKTKIRESFARVKMIIDLVLGKKPKYLGKQIIIS